MFTLAAAVARKLAGPNFHTVEDGRAWRVARGRLGDRALRGILTRHGVATVIDLRRPVSSQRDLRGCLPKRSPAAARRVSGAGFSRG